MSAFSNSKTFGRFRAAISCFAVALSFAACGGSGGGSSSPGAGSVDVPFDNLKDRQVHWNTHLIRPLSISADGTKLFAVNQGGARIVIFDLASLAKLAEIPVGPGVVSIAERPNSSELWFVDRISGSVGVIELSSSTITHSIRVGADPHGIAFTPSGDRAYIACSAVDRVDVIATASYSIATSIAIPAKNPRAIVVHGGAAYVVPLLSGNNTAPVGKSANGEDVDDIVEVDSLANHPNLPQLPDRDLLVIPTQTDPTQDHLDATRTVSGLGTILLNLHERPGANELWIPNTEALNAVHKGEKNFVAGQCVDNRITIVDASGSLAPKIVDLDLLTPLGQRCAQPAALAFDPVRPFVYVCGYGSDSITVLDASGAQPAWLGTIDLPFVNVYPQLSGPRACSVDAQGKFLYVLNKGDTSISRIDLTQLPTTAGFQVSAPTPISLGHDSVSGAERFGRNDLVNGRNSKSETTSCASCHVDGNYDGVVWNLGKFLDAEGTPNGALAFPLDDKGPMVTQSVRRMFETGPWHWRGEKSKLVQFNQAFIDLMEREENGVPKDLGPHFQYLAHYMKRVAYPANPRESLDRTLTAEQTEGARLFTQKKVSGNETCASCHALPLGTNGEITPSHVRGKFDTADTPQLRGLGDKLTPPFFIGAEFGTRTELGAGLTHGGAYPTIQALLLAPHPTLPGKQAFDLSSKEADAIAAFLMVLDTGLAPATAYQATANASNAAQVAANELAFLMSQAELGNCDLIFRGAPEIFQGVKVWPSGLYDVATHRFRVALAAAPEVDPNQLIADAAAGKPVTFIGVPLWMGLPMALDRDLDGLYDLDELVAGTDPENSDTDKDGFPDGYEVKWGMNPLAHDSSSPDTVAPTLIGAPRAIFETSNTLKFEFETSEVANVKISYNGGIPVQRLPLQNDFDFQFSVILNELEPATPYHIQLELTDPSGNTNDVFYDLSTKPRVFGDPVYVEDLGLGVVQVGSGEEFDANVQLRVGKIAPHAGYVLHGTLDFQAQDGSVTTIAADAQSQPSASDGTAQFHIALPPTGAGNPGHLWFVIDDVKAPSGAPAWVKSIDLIDFASIDW